MEVLKIYYTAVAIDKIATLKKENIFDISNLKEVTKLVKFVHL